MGQPCRAPPLTVSATASDNVGVARAQFRLDGGNLGAAVTTPPYSISSNTTTATSGSHTLTAHAFDAAGNMGSSSVGVTRIDYLQDGQVLAVLSPPVFTFSARQADPNGPSSLCGRNRGMDRHSFKSIAPDSVTRNDRTYGVLQLTLKDASYDWEFVPVAGWTYTDSGSMKCR